jgi:hypothetical protein
MAVLAMILALWRARQRAIDLKILWPICKQGAPDLDHAKAAFAYHAFSDPAWLCLGEEAIVEAIDKLE